MTRIGIFGGSFDPIHNAHLLLAELCKEALALEEVWFVPAFISPLKQNVAPISPLHRKEMVRLAIADNPAFRIDTRELDRGGVSYTIDTISQIASEVAGAEIYLLMGADSVADLPRWKSPRELLSLVSIAAIARGGVGEPDWESIRGCVSPERWQKTLQTVSVPQLELSSSEIRRRVRGKLSIRYQVPEAVADYIQQHRLYSEG